MIARLTAPSFGVMLLGVLILAAACGSDASEGQGVVGDVTSGAAGDDTSDSAIPVLDRSIRSVELASIVFDTFDGGFLPLDQADDSTIETLRDLIAPINSPVYESVAEADTWIDDDEVVVTYIDNDGNAWAYPLRILNFHEIVNDNLGGLPIVVTYCPLCGSGAIYDRRVEGRELSFSNTSALHQSDMVMVDRQTGSYWWQVAGRSIVGPLTHATLRPLPSSNERWSTWKTDHPDGRVLARLPSEANLPDPFLDLGRRIDEGLVPRFLDPAALTDTRYPAGTSMVFVTDDAGLTTDDAAGEGTTYAWPIDLGDPDESTATINGRTFTITDGTVTITDKPQAGTDKPQADAADTGADASRGTITLPARTAMWFAVVAAFPDVITPG